MYDADYDNYLNDRRKAAGKIELKTPAMDAGHPPDFVTKDSGTRTEHPDGVVRDTDAGKPRFDLMFPKGVPFDAQLMTRVAELYERGGVKYGMRNWEKSATPETLEHHEAALMRHVYRFLTEVEDGEDHAAAVVWNVNAVDLCRRKIGLKKVKEVTEAAQEATEELFKNDSLNTYIFPYVGKDTASTGKYYQKEIRADSYREAKSVFDLWLSGQPFYNSHPDMIPVPAPLAPAPALDPEWPHIEWSQGDVLEEVKVALDGKPYTWVYHDCSDTWLYKRPEDSKPSAESALSSKKLFALYGPLTCTKGNHVGRSVGGA